MKEVEGHDATRGTFRENKKPKKYANYATFMCNIIEFEASSYEEAIEGHVWKELMIGDYQSIFKNDVCDIFTRPKGKFIVS